MPTNVPGTKGNNKNKPNKESYRYTPLYQADFIIGSCSSCLLYTSDAADE